MVAHDMVKKETGSQHIAINLKRNHWTSLDTKMDPSLNFPELKICIPLSMWLTRILRLSERKKLEKVTCCRAGERQILDLKFDPEDYFKFAATEHSGTFPSTIVRRQRQK